MLVQKAAVASVEDDGVHFFQRVGSDKEEPELG